LLAVDRARKAILGYRAILGISENTVAILRQEDHEKVEATGRTAAVVEAIHLGRIALPDGMLATNPVR
jgi:hypothetical protein